MPTGPKGGKRPADVIGNAVHVMRVLTGETLPKGDGALSRAEVAASLGSSILSCSPSASGLSPQP